MYSRIHTLSRYSNCPVARCESEIQFILQSLRASQNDEEYKVFAMQLYECSKVSYENGNSNLLFFFLDYFENFTFTKASKYIIGTLQMVTVDSPNIYAEVVSYLTAFLLKHEFPDNRQENHIRAVKYLVKLGQVLLIGQQYDCACQRFYLLLLNSIQAVVGCKHILLGEFRNYVNAFLKYYLEIYQYEELPGLLFSVYQYHDCDREAADMLAESANISSYIANYYSAKKVRIANFNFLAVITHTQYCDIQVSLFEEYLQFDKYRAIVFRILRNLVSLNQNYLYVLMASRKICEALEENSNDENASQLLQYLVSEE